MGTKDATEKILADYNDVFADIINALIFKGEQKVKPEDLESTGQRSMYKADTSKLHEQERDVSKFWKKCNIKLTLFGMENQTKPEKYMPLRGIGYDGASYRSQLLNLKAGEEPCAVLTIVLYFGTDKKWDEPTNLKEVINVPEELEEYINDYKINVFNIAWLSDEEIARFKSDFKVVANYFCQKRRNSNYVPKDKTVIKHVDAVLKLLSVMTGDSRYEEILTDNEEESEVYTMDAVLTRCIEKGKAEGIAKGRAEERNVLLEISKLISEGLTSEEIVSKGYDKESVDLALCLRK